MIEKLFDETFAHETEDYRTLWYGYLEVALSDELIEQLTTIIKSDLAEPKTKRTVNHWIFYFKMQNDDALGEKVRQSLMVREDTGDFVVNFNMSDFSFVTQYDEVEAFMERFLLRLKTNKIR